MWLKHKQIYAIFKEELWIIKFVKSCWLSYKSNFKTKVELV